MKFWNSLLVEKSWNILQQLKKERFRFIVIGGWATYLWAKQQKSKDIDIIIPDIRELEFLSQKFTLRKNDNLRKYEIKIEEIDIDIYVIYYSKLALPIEFIVKHTTMIEGFEVVQPEILLILKQGAEYERKESIKGQKDRIDIMTLLCHAKINFDFYNKILEQHSILHYRRRLKEIIQTFKELRHLDLNVKDFAKIKKQLLGKV